MGTCPYCKRTDFVIHKIPDSKQKSGYRYDLFDKGTDSYHNIKRCAELHPQAAREFQKVVPEKMVPKLYYPKETKPNEGIELPYYIEPKKQDIVKMLCSCSSNDVFPVCLIKPHYYFSSNEILKITHEYWCANCGLELTIGTIKEYFTEYDFTKISNLSLELRHRD